MQVQPVREVGTLFQRRRPVGWDGHARQQEPVAEQDADDDPDQRPGAQPEEKQAGRRVAEGGALEHAGIANVFEGFEQAAVVEDSQREKDRRPLPDVPDGPGASLQGAQPGHSQGDGEADDEQEQREDQVVEGKPFPILVLQLAGQIP